MRNLVEGATVLLGLIAPFALLVVLLALFNGNHREQLAAIGLICVVSMYKADRIVDRDKKSRAATTPR